MDYRGINLLTATALAGLSAALIAAPANAATPTLTDAHIIADFSYSTKQQPENIALEPNGSADLTFNRSLQVGRVAANGSLTNLSDLPEDGGNNPSTGSSTVVLTAANGLDNPTSIAISGSTVYITNGAYFTGTDPNLMLATYTG